MSICVQKSTLCIRKNTFRGGRKVEEAPKMVLSVGSTGAQKKQARPKTECLPDLPGGSASRNSYKESSQRPSLKLPDDSYSHPSNPWFNPFDHAGSKRIMPFVSSFTDRLILACRGPSSSRWHYQRISSPGQRCHGRYARQARYFRRRLCVELQYDWSVHLLMMFRYGGLSVLIRRTVQTKRSSRRQLRFQPT